MSSLQPRAATRREEKADLLPVDDYTKEGKKGVFFKLNKTTTWLIILFVLFCIMAMYLFLHYHVQITVSKGDHKHEKVYEANIGLNKENLDVVTNRIMEKIPKSVVVNNHNIHEDHGETPSDNVKQSQNSATTSNNQQEGKKQVLTDIASYARNFESDRNSRREAVRNAFKFAYNNYEKFAFGMDELKPVSGAGHNWVKPTGMGMSVADSLDTMFIMGLSEEFDRATDWVANKLPKCDTFDWEGSVFETTIRMVGGFLSAYELSGKKVFLEKAKEYADCLLPGFDTPTGIPYAAVNFKRKVGVNFSWNHMASVISEFGSVELEFRKLSQLSGDQKYDQAVTKIMQVMKKHEPADGLYPVLFHPHTAQFVSERVTLGALGDSWYEYLLKQWLLTNRKESTYKEMYLNSLNGIMSKLVKTYHTEDGDFSFIAELSNGNVVNKVDHLVCFAAGMLALGENFNVSPENKREEVMTVAKNFARSCYQSYKMTSTGLGPEIFYFNQENGHIRPGARHYILRPETVESLFILYRVTGDKMYQEWAWDIFQAIETNCKVQHGYSGVKNVMAKGLVEHDDVQQSFLLAETFKYLYLIFSPNDVIPLDQWVFNTEAHPLRVIASPLGNGNQSTK